MTHNQYLSLFRDTSSLHLNVHCHPPSLTHTVHSDLPSIVPWIPLTDPLSILLIVTHYNTSHCDPPAIPLRLSQWLIIKISPWLTTDTSFCDPPSIPLIMICDPPSISLTVHSDQPPKPLTVNHHQYSLWPAINTSHRSLWSRWYQDYLVPGLFDPWTIRPLDYFAPRPFSIGNWWFTLSLLEKNKLSDVNHVLDCVISYT